MLTIHHTIVQSVGAVIGLWERRTGFSSRSAYLAREIVSLMAISGDSRFFASGLNINPLASRQGHVRGLQQDMHGHIEGFRLPACSRRSAPTMVLNFLCAILHIKRSQYPQSNLLRCTKIHTVSSCRYNSDSSDS